MEDNIRLCNHCNNVTSHQLVADGYTSKVFGNRKEETKKDFTYFFVKCDTCGEHSLLGCFIDQLPNPKLTDIPVLFPKPKLLESSVPENIRRVYEQTAPLKNKNPDAFAGQIRRALEYLCVDKKAKGRNLASQIESLVEMDVLPVTLNEMTTVIREMGNLGVHAKEEGVTFKDAEDIDDFFRFVIEYVYVAPAKSKQVKLNYDWRQFILKNGDLVNEVQWVLQNEEPTTSQELDHDQQFEDSGDSYYPYEYEDETILIVKKLKDLHSKAELQDYLYKDPGFLSTRETEIITNAIWDLWSEHKKNDTL